ncbi:hypothetical protein FH972_022835 [Carpinus fangiana]|uniref:Uncharacterized protein n=1 Tax=Carpinus fangiana TaxID=176857 RepID=A0A5N6KU27_9ROSI|nr:hypothetical protein FH972_022835 [Carpinus fangiana]
MGQSRHTLMVQTIAGVVQDVGAVGPTANEDALGGGLRRQRHGRREPGAQSRCRHAGHVCEAGAGAAMAGSVAKKTKLCSGRCQTADRRRAALGSCNVESVREADGADRSYPEARSALGWNEGGGLFLYVAPHVASIAGVQSLSSSHRGAIRSTRRGRVIFMAMPASPKHDQPLAWRPIWPHSVPTWAFASTLVALPSFPPLRWPCMRIAGGLTRPLAWNLISHVLR